MGGLGSEADSQLAAQFRPLTESAPERVSCPAHAGEAGSDRIRALRRRKGPHSTASVLLRHERVLGFVRRSGTQIAQVDYATQRRSVIAMCLLEIKWCHDLGYWRLVSHGK